MSAGAGYAKVIGGGFELAGGLVSAYAQYGAGKAEMQAHRYNAAILRKQAKALAMSTETETELGQDEFRRLKSEQRASYASSGAAMEGTPLTVLANEATKMQRDILEMRRTRSIEGMKLESQAKMSLWQGRQAKKAGRFGAASTVLSSVGQFIGGLGGS